MQRVSQNSGVQNDLRQLAGDVVFIAGILLCNRRSDTNGRGRNILPEKHLGSALCGIKAKDLAICWADAFEELQNLQGIQIVHCLSGVLLQIGGISLGVFEGRIKHNLALRRDLPLGRRFVVGDKLVVHKLHDTQLPNDSLYGATVGASLCLPTLLVDFLEDLHTSEIVDSWLSQLFEDLAAIIFHQQNFGAILADALESGLDVFEVSDVEDGKRKSNVTEMARAVLQWKQASRTCSRFARGSLLSY